MDRINKEDLKNIPMCYIFKGCCDSINLIPKDLEIVGNIVMVQNKLYLFSGSGWTQIADNGGVDYLVIEFISGLTKDDPHIIDVFANGFCYWFAVILKERFNGKIVYNHIDNHFACEIEGKIYDAKGLDSTNLYQYWNEYKLKDSNETARLYQYCIMKFPDRWKIDYENNTCNGYPLKLYNE